MGRYSFEIADAAKADLKAEVLALQEFDSQAGARLVEEFLQVAELLRTFPKLHALAFVSKGVSYRRFTVMQRTFLYHFAKDTIWIDRVFGPGRLNREI